MIRRVAAVRGTENEAKIRKIPMPTISASMIVWMSILAS
jgi:hypothetical protein